MELWVYQWYSDGTINYKSMSDELMREKVEESGGYQLLDIDLLGQSFNAQEDVYDSL